MMGCGSVKRAADMAVRQGKCSIQNASDVYSWAKSRQDSKVEYFQYTSEDIMEAETELNKKPVPQPVPGTLKLHAVVPIDKTTVLTRDVSCYCVECASDITNTRCPGWSKHTLKKKTNEQKDNLTDTQSKPDQLVESTNESSKTELQEEQDVIRHTDTMLKLDNDT